MKTNISKTDNVQTLAYNHYLFQKIKNNVLITVTLNIILLKIIMSNINIALNNVQKQVMLIMVMFVTSNVKIMRNIIIKLIINVQQNVKLIITLNRIISVLN